MRPNHTLPSNLDPSAYGAIAPSGGASSSASALPPNEPDVSQHVAKVLAQAKRDGFVEGATTLGRGIPADREKFFKLRIAEERNRLAEQGIGETRAAYVAKRLQKKIASLKSQNLGEIRLNVRVQFPRNIEEFVRQIAAQKLNETPKAFLDWAIRVHAITTMRANHGNIAAGFQTLVDAECNRLASSSVDMPQLKQFAAQRYVLQRWGLEKLRLNQEIELRARGILEWDWNEAALRHIPLTDDATHEMHAEWEQAVENYVLAELRRPPPQSGEQHAAKRLRLMSPESRIEKPQSCPFSDEVWMAAQKEARECAQKAEREYAQKAAREYAPQRSLLPDWLHIERAGTGGAVYVVQSGFMELRRIDAKAHSASKPDVPALTMAIASQATWQEAGSLDSFGFSDDILTAARSLAQEEDCNYIKGLREYADGTYCARYQGQVLQRVAVQGGLNAQNAKIVAIARILSAVAADTTLKGNRHYSEYEKAKDAKALIPLIKRNETSLREIIAPAFGDLSIFRLQRKVEEARSRLEDAGNRPAIVGRPDESAKDLDEEPKQEGEMEGKKVPHMVWDIRAGGFYFGSISTRQFPRKFGGEAPLRAATATVLAEAYRQFVDDVMSQASENADMRRKLGIPALDNYIKSRIEQEVAKYVGDGLEDRLAHIEDASRIEKEVRKLEGEPVAEEIKEMVEMGTGPLAKQETERRWVELGKEQITAHTYNKRLPETDKDVKKIFYRRKLEEFARANLSAEWSSNVFQDLYHRQRQRDSRLREGDLATLAKETFRAEWYNAAEDCARRYFVAKYKPRLQEMPLEIIRKIFNHLPAESKPHFIRASEVSETLKYKALPAPTPPALELAERLAERAEGIEKFHADECFLEFKSVLKDANDLRLQNRLAVYVALARATDFLQREGPEGAVLLLEHAGNLFHELGGRYVTHPDRDVMAEKMDKAKYGIFHGIASMASTDHRRILVRRALENRIHDCIDPLFALLESIEDERVVNEMSYRGLVDWCGLFPNSKDTEKYLGKLVTFVEKKQHHLSDHAKATAITDLLRERLNGKYSNYSNVKRSITQRAPAAAVGIMERLVDVAETLKDDKAMLAVTTELIPWLHMLHIFREAGPPVRRGVAMVERFAADIPSLEIWLEMSKLRQGTQYKKLLADYHAA